MQYDVTERERHAAATRHLEEKLQYVLELLPEGYWDWNVATDAAYYSDRWCESLGYDPSEIEPHVRAWVNLIHPDDYHRVLDACTAMSRAGTRSISVKSA